MKYSIVFIFILAVSTPLLTAAQNANENTNPQGIQNLQLPVESSGLVQDALNLFDKVKENVPLIDTQNIQTPGDTLPTTPITSLSGIMNLWNNVNAWCEEHIGISLREIINTVINFMIWIWELIIKLIRAVLLYL